MDVGTQTIVSWIEEQVNVEETPLEATDNSIDKQDSNEGTTDGNKEGEIEEEARLQELAATLSESSSSEDEREDDEEEGKEYKPVSVNVPWPAVLQYMRETDSESSKYFGLGKNRTKIITDEQEERNEEELCQFCGEALKHLSLLPDSLEKEPEFCCEDIREYIVLLALYTKRLQEHKLRSRPGQIRIKSQVKEEEEAKTAQERALERMRRKQKWEEKCREMKILQSSSVSAMSRQTKVIKFSLSSENCMSTGWVTDMNKGKKKKKKQPLPVVLPLPSIPMDDTPPVMDETSCGFIDKICYSSGHPLSIILPDNTGQAYYPSDNLALLQVTLHPSVSTYLIFDDNKSGGLIGYIDDYGRGWVKGDYSIRFLSTLHEGFLFDNSGRSKTWVWSDSGMYSLHLPLVFKLNQYITVKYNNHDDISISLTAQQKQHKIQIKRVVTMGGTGKPVVDKSVKYFNKELEKMTHRFNSHLSSFQQSIKLYNSSEKSKVLPPISGSRTVFKRARNSSIGTVTFQQ